MCPERGPSCSLLPSSLVHRAGPACRQRNRQHSTTSTGFVVEGRRILTNAHSCENFVQVRVRRRGEDEKFIAEVLAINEECDCALLTVREVRQPSTDGEGGATGAMPTRAVEPRRPLLLRCHLGALLERVACAGAGAAAAAAGPSYRGWVPHRRGHAVRDQWRREPHRGGLVLARLRGAARHPDRCRYQLRCATSRPHDSRVRHADLMQALRLMHPLPLREFGRASTHG
eukprot:scaffold179_cov368-Prasinococcus_capsulatus_cf.AAC.35